MRKTTAERIEIQKVKKEQTQNALKLLLQQQRKEERKARTHRFCVRGAIVEKLLPDLARLTEEQFDTFVQKVLLTPHTNRILAGFVPPPPEPTDEPKGDNSAVQTG
jgi:uncharacterized protein YeaC (DUF1315 family)